MGLDQGRDILRPDQRPGVESAGDADAADAKVRGAYHRMGVTLVPRLCAHGGKLAGTNGWRGARLTITGAIRLCPRRFGGHTVATDATAAKCARSGELLVGLRLPRIHRICWMLLPLAKITLSAGLQIGQRTPRSLAGRLRRSQAFLKDARHSFKRDGREGNRITKMTSRGRICPRQHRQLEMSAGWARFTRTAVAWLLERADDADGADANGAPSAAAG
jgi:hypothetical protein